MIYDEIYLIDKIKDSLTGEMTVFDNTWFEFKDCVVSITGHVQQSFDFTYSTDHFLLSGMELISRTAVFDEILISSEDGERVLTLEELYYFEKQLDI